MFGFEFFVASSLKRKLERQKLKSYSDPKSSKMPENIQNSTVFLFALVL